MTNFNPSVDPANYNNFGGVTGFIFKKLMENIDDVLPGQVVSFNRDTNTAVVQPLVKLVSTEGTGINRSQYQAFVVQIGGAGFTLNFKLNPGDLGLLIACDRDISACMQRNALAKPNTARMKSFSDSFFIPLVLRGNTVAPSDAGNAVLQSLDNSVKLSLGTNKLTAAAATVEIDADNLIINAPVNVMITTPLLKVVGNIEATGTITPNVP